MKFPATSTCCPGGPSRLITNQILSVNKFPTSTAALQENWNTQATQVKITLYYYTGHLVHTHLLRALQVFSVIPRHYLTVSFAGFWWFHLSSVAGFHYLVLFYEDGLDTYFP